MRQSHKLTAPSGVSATGLRGLKAENGNTLVEYALVFVVFMAMLWGIIEFSRALYAYHFVDHAAKSATRWAAVNGLTCNSDAGGSDPGSCSAPVTCTNGNCTLCASGCSPATATDISNYVKMITPLGIDPNQVATVVSWPTPTTEPAICTTNPTVPGCNCYTTATENSPGCTVQVQVSYKFTFLFPTVADLLQFGAPAAPITLSSTSEMVIAH
jgi:hypothetical protein